jgi:hypothetical protein
MGELRTGELWGSKVLNPASLQSAVAAILAKPSPDPASVAAQLASAYTSYAAAGQVGASVLVISPGSTSAMAAAILATIAVPSPVPTGWGLGWSNGLLAFWGVPVAVVGAQSGAVIPVCPGAPAAAAVITAGASAPVPSSDPAAAAVASGCAAATATVTAAVAPPPGTILPVL